MYWFYTIKHPPLYSTLAALFGRIIAPRALLTFIHLAYITMFRILHMNIINDSYNNNNRRHLPGFHKILRGKSVSPFFEIVVVTAIAISLTPT